MEGKKLSVPAALLTALGLTGCLEAPQTPAQIKGEQDRGALSQQFDEACVQYGAAMNELRRLQGSVLQGKTPDEAALDAAAQEVEKRDDVMIRIVETRTWIEETQKLDRQEWRCGEDIDNPGQWVSNRDSGNPVTEWIRKMR